MLLKVPHCELTTQRYIQKNYMYLCRDCKDKKCSLDDNIFPVWYDINNVAHFDVPNQLSCLCEGEKLLIQQVSVFVPLHHLKFGQIGTQGHVVSFQQDLSSLCKTLPRLPKDTNLIRVIKKFKMNCGEIGTKTFSIRKKVILEALGWLKTYNMEYKDIIICESNLNWIENEEEQVLPPALLEETLIPELLSCKNQQDRGPSKDQICNVVDKDVAEEPFYGLADENYGDKPKKKDLTITEGLRKAHAKGKSLMEPGLKML